jgi:hypothetical protein
MAKKIAVLWSILNSNSRGSHCTAAATAHHAYFNSESGLCGGAIPLNFTTLQPSVVFSAKRKIHKITTMHFD